MYCIETVVRVFRFGADLSNWTLFFQDFDICGLEDHMLQRMSAIARHCNARTSCFRLTAKNKWGVGAVDSSRRTRRQLLSVPTTLRKQKEFDIVNPFEVPVSGPVLGLGVQHLPKPKHAQHAHFAHFRSTLFNIWNWTAAPNGSFVFLFAPQMSHCKPRR